MEFADSSRVGGEREVCTNRSVIVGYLWAICGQRERREGEEEGEGEGKGEGEGEGEGEGKSEGGGRGGGGEGRGEGGGGEGTVGIRGQFMFSFLRLGKLQSPFCDFSEKIEIKVCVCVYVCVCVCVCVCVYACPPHMNLSTALFHRRSENLRCKNICVASVSHENKKHKIILTTNN